MATHVGDLIPHVRILFSRVWALSCAWVPAPGSLGWRTQTHAWKLYIISYVVHMVLATGHKGCNMTSRRSPIPALTLVLDVLIVPVRAVNGHGSNLDLLKP